MKKKLIASLAILPLLAALAGCSATNASASSGSTAGKTVTVKIGTTDSSADYWPVLEKKALAQGIDIKLVNFSDYNQANPALTQKQIDLNLFQHLQFLGTYNVSAGQDLTPIGATLIVPLGLYSTKYTSVKDIPKGGTIAIPNDPANLARGLNVLKSDAADPGGHRPGEVAGHRDTRGCVADGRLAAERRRFDHQQQLRTGRQDRPEVGALQG
jgi:ABC-type metal ion transport system substrate-binding protein